MDESQAPAATRKGAVILVRHGEPALSRKIRLSARGYRDWWARYEEGGLKAGQTPPARLIETAAKADALFASTRRRAVETAQALVGGRDFTRAPIYIEAPLPPPPLPDWLKLPPRWWGVISRIAWWLFGHTEGQESFAEAEERARRAARDLMDLAGRGQTVLVIAHGFFNLMIGRALQASGWRLTEDQGFRYWSARRFEPGPDTPSAAAAASTRP
jgi:broad specificity phosphatase PhoE